MTLERELEIVEDYLALESLRLGERLRIERDIAPRASRVRIPVMLLQTVVENAIKHGIAELPGGGVLRISARLRGRRCSTIEVENPRPANGRNAHRESGIGLRNATERLRLLYGAARESRAGPVEPGMRAVARIRIPQHSMKAIHRRR